MVLCRSSSFLAEMRIISSKKDKKKTEGNPPRADNFFCFSSLEEDFEKNSRKSVFVQRKYMIDWVIKKRKYIFMRKEIRNKMMTLKKILVVV